MFVYVARESFTPVMHQDARADQGESIMAHRQKDDRAQNPARRKSAGWNTFFLFCFVINWASVL
jgi:Cu/Zn superoxide dismutase